MVQTEAPPTSPILRQPTLVDVTAEDIRNGEPGNWESCPIALALGRSFPEAHFISVAEDVEDIVWVEESEYRLPEVATAFVKNYDSRELELCRPFRFVLEIYRAPR